jgi:hypothetical protein
LQGDPDPEKELWSRRDDVTLANPFGGYRRGWREVEAGLDLAADGFAKGGTCVFDEISRDAGPDCGFVFEMERFESTLTDEEKQCRIHGIPLHLAGPVYKSFSWARHVLTDVPKGWDDWSHPPKHWPLYVHIDPHPQTPHAVLFCAVSPFGERFYYADHFQKCSVAELAHYILDFTKGYRIVECHCDPLGFIEHPITNTSMATEFAANGLFVDKATKALAHGVIKVNGELAKTPPVLFFSPYCKRTLWEIQRYCWDGENDRPIDADDHMMENLYRMELSEPRWVDLTNPCPPFEDMSILSPNFREDEQVSLAAI